MSEEEMLAARYEQFSAIVATAAIADSIYHGELARTHMQAWVGQHLWREWYIAYDTCVIAARQGANFQIVREAALAVLLREG